MELTEEQLVEVAGWVKGGASLSDVQKRLEEVFGIRITYMETRLLVDDLDLELASQGPSFAEIKPAAAAADAAGGVRVSLDKVTRPGSLVSGSVTFSDGVGAQWALDQMGRLSLNASQQGYRPSDADLQEFQKELSALIEKSGMF